MVTLTWPNGQKVKFDGAQVLRIRALLPSEKIPGSTLVDWIERDFFKEPAADVAAAVKLELKSLVELTLPYGEPVWFNGLKAAGPYYVVPTNRTDGVNSAVLIGGKRQLVANSPKEVADVVKAAGGVVLPIRNDDLFSTIVRISNSEVSDWDPVNHHFALAQFAMLQEASNGGLSAKQHHALVDAIRGVLKKQKTSKASTLEPLIAEAVITVLAEPRPIK